MSIFKISRLVLVIGLLLGLYHPAQAVVLKIATLSPDGSTWMQKFREGATQVAKATDRRVRFKFYPGGVMGSDKAVLRKIRVGQLHGGAFSGGTLAGYSGEAQLYNLPLKFKSFAEVDYVRGRMDEAVMAGLKKGGFTTFGLADGGFAYIMSNAPVDSVAMLRKQKVWTPEQDLTAARALKRFGITPIALPIADVRTALQTGLIDTVAISPVAAIVLQWHTQVKYLTVLPLSYLYGILAVDNKAFARISPPDRKVVNRIMTRILKEMDQMNRQDNVRALEALRRQGIEFVEPPAESLATWNKMADTVSRHVIEAGEVPADLVTVMQKHLDDFRSLKAAGDG